MSERKVVEYVLASGDSYYFGKEERGLVAHVEEFLKLGYQPFGSMSVHNEDGSARWYVQPMVKYEEKKHPSNTITPIERNQYDEESRN